MLRKLLCRFGFHQYKKDIKYRHIGYDPIFYHVINRYECKHCPRKTEWYAHVENLKTIQ